MKDANSKPTESQRPDSGAAGRKEFTNGTNEADKKHALVVKLFSMLQAPAASVVVPTFGERNP